MKRAGPTPPPVLKSIQWELLQPSDPFNAVHNLPTIPVKIIVRAHR